MATTTIHIEFSTTRYEFTHGRKPKGRGYWAFDAGARHGKGVEFMPGDLSFAEAKRAFCKLLRERTDTTGAGFIGITVQVCT